MAATASSKKFGAFDIKDADYKSVNGHGIPVSVLTPKDARQGKHPVLVRWHGGGFATGQRLFHEW